MLYAISAAILATAGIQFYWNYKNYQAQKQQLINEVQISLDKAVDDYYTKLARETTFGFSFDETSASDLLDESSDFNTIIQKIDASAKNLTNLDSLEFPDIEGLHVLRGSDADSLAKVMKQKSVFRSPDSLKRHMEGYRRQHGVIAVDNFELLTSKIVISINNDSLVLETLDSLFMSELTRKNVSVDYRLMYKDSATGYRDWLNVDGVKSDLDSTQTAYPLRTLSRSSFLPENSMLQVAFSNATFLILKRSMGGILLSLMLVAIVISCLFYLLFVIRSQKQLAEVKNDLISNITHEFKTPIATIGVAIESMRNFNALNDPRKATSYLDVSTSQLNKLNTMVEKLLETASLDSNEIQLDRSEVNLLQLCDQLVEKHRMAVEGKSIHLDIKDTPVIAFVDEFHLENAINNILDNAVKYGGDTIRVALRNTADAIHIRISDNGGNLRPEHKDKIFEKFYRVPQGNTHDVKGFGIGLYYTRKIIEKHGGSIRLSLKDNLTTFNITIPHA